ncbi:MAG: sulfatase-like hydrolase/transferase [Verrucomicrobiales bacterium]|nr:sulfatase-like hydrolase/transferase [Verrucomicrobiales bacterium]
MKRSLTVLATALFLPLQSPAETPPNVVLILSDDQAWNEYSFMGHPHIETPRIDQFARQSLTFTRGYVPSSLCRPSLASIITGLHPFQHKITGNDPPLGLRPHRQLWDAANEKIDTFITEVATLPRLLGSQKGYLSFQTGKWWEGTPENGGFTSGMSHGDPSKGGRHGDDGLKIGRKGMQPAFDFIDSATADKKPFFLWHAPFLPHNPHNPPKQLVEKYRPLTPSIAVANYWATVEWFDQTCGQLFDYLDQNNLSENTIVLYVCDNGWIQDPDRPNRYAERSKRSPYDGGLRTPVIVRWPGKVSPKMDTTTAVLSTDIAPTILKACGLEPTTDMHGIDLLDTAALQARPFITGDIYLHNAIDLERPVSALSFRWIIRGDYKLISPFKPNAPGGTTQLFNITADPWEHQDLAAGNKRLVRSLEATLDSWYPLPRH